MPLPSAPFPTPHARSTLRPHAPPTARQTVAAWTEFWHLIMYAADGKGMRWRHGRLPFDLISDTSQNLSELLTIVLLVSVACGWTLVDGTSRHLSRVFATTVGIGAVQMLLELYSRGYEDDFSSYHDHDHWPGKLLMLLRTCVCGVLWAGAWETIKKAGGYDKVRPLIRVG